MLDDLKGYLTGMVARWLLKVVGGGLLFLGYSAGETTEIVAGAAGILIGIVISVVQHFLAKRSDPDVPGTAPPVS